jgi:hypothetical protein
MSQMSQSTAPIHPRTMPAIAIPRPPCTPPERSICPFAEYPNTRAGTDKMPISRPRIPNTSAAVADPFAFGWAVAP